MSTTKASLSVQQPPQPQPQQREELPPHKITEQADAYLATLSEEGKQLHVLATKMLGSSYFVDRTHGFRKWKK